MSEKMTIHRGLAELKLIDAKIQKQVERTVPLGIQQAGKKVLGVYSNEEFIQYANSNWDSTTSLITRKSAIKSAIILANASTSVKIATVEMTIAEAINKKTTISLQKEFVVAMRKKQQTILSDFNKKNEIVKQNCQTVVEAALGKDSAKITKEDIDNVSKPFMTNNEYLLVDPLKLDEKLTALEKEIGDFEADVDAALSEINATTFITI